MGVRLPPYARARVAWSTFAISDDGGVTSLDPSATRPQPVVGAPGPPSLREFVLPVSGAVAALILALLAVLPLPYSIAESGETFDIYGAEESAPLISISGAPTYEPSGELRLTTVSRTSGEKNGPVLGELISAWLSASKLIEPWIDYGDVSSYYQELWVTSQELAAVAALGQLGQPVPVSIRLAHIGPESHANGQLEVDDVFVAIDGVTIVTWEDFDGALQALAPGDPVTITVDRAGTSVTVTFDTIDDGEGNALMGVYPDPTFDMPFEVNVGIDGVSGPSGGLIFSLAIIDLLTPEDELNGARIAGTGEIDLDGEVGPIGGIRLKMLGAVGDGAEWFLAPVKNCPEVVGHVPDGLRVVAVATLDEAYRAVVAIGDGEGADLPTCV